MVIPDGPFWCQLQMMQNVNANDDCLLRVCLEPCVMLSSADTSITAWWRRWLVPVEAVGAMVGLSVLVGRAVGSVSQWKAGGRGLVIWSGLLWNAAISANYVEQPGFGCSQKTCILNGVGDWGLVLLSLWRYLLGLSFMAVRGLQ